MVRSGIRNEVEEPMLLSQRTRCRGKEATCSVLGIVLRRADPASPRYPSHGSNIWSPGYHTTPTASH